MAKPRGVKFRISRTYRKNVKQPFHYVVVGGNGEPQTVAENFDSMADTFRRVEGLWAGFAVAHGWQGGLDQIGSIPLTDDSLVPLTGGKYGFVWKGLTYGPKLSVRKIAREMIRDFDGQAAKMKSTRFTVTGVKDLKDKIDGMKIGGLSRKSLKRAVTKSAKLVETQLKASTKPITPAMKRAAAKFAADRQKARQLRAMR